MSDCVSIAIATQLLHLSFIYLNVAYSAGSGSDPFVTSLSFESMENGLNLRLNGYTLVTSGTYYHLSCQGGCKYTDHIVMHNFVHQL